MVQVRFAITLTVPEDGDEAAARAARELLMQIAAEIIRAAARLNNRDG